MGAAGWPGKARARTRAGDVTPAYKLYVSPVCAQLPEALGAVAAAVSRSASFQWKVGSDVYGLLRPDKIVAYFTRYFADLHATAADLLAKLDGCPAQGVPFTAAIESGRLLSWGIDPPSDEHTVPWLKRESWRAQISNPWPARSLWRKPRRTAECRRPVSRWSECGSTVSTPIRGPQRADDRPHRFLRASRRRRAPTRERVATRGSASALRGGRRRRPEPRELAQITTKLIDPDAAELVKEFASGCTIAQAVARFSKGKHADAERILEEALPVLQTLIAAGLLVPADSNETLRVAPLLAGTPGVNGWEIMRSVQAFDDTDVYQVRRTGGEVCALKLCHPHPSSASLAIQREAKILAGLNSPVAPRLRESGEWSSRPYLIMEWLAGTDAQTTCAEFRREAGGDPVAICTASPDPFCGRIASCTSEESFMATFIRAMC